MPETMVLKIRPVGGNGILPARENVLPRTTSLPISLRPLETRPVDRRTLIIEIEPLPRIPELPFLMPVIRDLPTSDFGRALVVINPESPRPTLIPILSIEPRAIVEKRPVDILTKRQEAVLRELRKRLQKPETDREIFPKETKILEQPRFERPEFTTAKIPDLIKQRPVESARIRPLTVIPVVSKFFQPSIFSDRSRPVDFPGMEETAQPVITSASNNPLVMAPDKPTEAFVPPKEIETAKIFPASAPAPASEQSSFKPELTPASSGFVSGGSGTSEAAVSAGGMTTSGSLSEAAGMSCGQRGESLKEEIIGLLFTGPAANNGGKTCSLGDATEAPKPPVPQRITISHIPASNPAAIVEETLIVTQ